MDDAAPGPASLAALREAVRNGREPPPARIVAGFKSYRWFVVGTVCVGAFMGQVDSSIAQMLLPRLELEFGARLSTVSWVAVAYLLAMAAFLPIFGRLADMVGRKLLYTGGFLLFVLSSALCGLAPSLPVLIAFRVAPGIGAALRSCGISIGVAAASSLLAWRLALRTGSGHNTLHAEAQQLLAAGRDVIVLLASFAAMAGVISLVRLPSRRSGDAKDAST